MSDVIIEGPNGARREDLADILRRATADELVRLAASGVPGAREEWERRRGAGKL